MDWIDKAAVALGTLFLGWMLHLSWKREKQAQDESEANAEMIKAMLQQPKGNKQ